VGPGFGVGILIREQDASFCRTVAGSFCRTVDHFKGVKAHHGVAMDVGRSVKGGIRQGSVWCGSVDM
jgi:hypothetical protein